MMDWQPIETAPKDGTRVIVALHAFGEPQGDRIVTLAAWHEADEPLFEGTGWHEDMGVGTLWPPTHWMPLPAPPTGDTK